MKLNRFEGFFRILDKGLPYWIHASCLPWSKIFGRCCLLWPKPDLRLVSPMRINLNLWLLRRIFELLLFFIAFHRKKVEKYTMRAPSFSSLKLGAASKDGRFSSHARFACTTQLLTRIIMLSRRFQKKVCNNIYCWVTIFRFRPRT